MKKLILLFSLVLLITTVKAQQSNETNQAPSAATTITNSNDVKECHGVSKDCPVPCTAANEKKCKGKEKDCTAHCEESKASSGTTGTMSTEYVNAGAVAAPATSACSDKKGMKGKSCCKGMSKASALNGAPPAAPVSETAPDASPK